MNAQVHLQCSDDMNLTQLKLMKLENYLKGFEKQTKSECLNVYYVAPSAQF
jgi:hypothetical protein